MRLKNTIRIIPNIIIFGFLFIFLLFKANFSFAADGSGTMSVSPLTAIKSSTGNTFNFTFTASESMNTGGVSLVVPSGWTAPQGTNGVTGYTTASSAGMIANVKDNADATTGWSAGTACSSGLSIDTTTKKEGTASLRCINGNEANNDKWYKNISAENWSGYTNVGFWIYSSSAITSGRLTFAYDDNANLASPISEISLGTNITANTWTYFNLALTGTRTSISSFGFIIKNPSALDNVTVRVDDILLGPGSVSFSGQNINLRFLQLSAGQTANIIYGNGGGASGITAPSTTGSYSFITKSRISDSGALTNISSSPAIQVNSLSATKFVIINPTDGTVDAPISVTVQAQAVDDSIDTNYQNDVTLNVSGGATGGGLVNIVNGVGTKDISSTIAQTVNLSLVDTQLTGLNVSSTQDVIFSAGATDAYFLNDPGDFTAGTRIMYTATRKDQYGNLVTNGAETAYLYTSSATGKFYDSAVNGNIITSIQFNNGNSTADFWYYDEIVGSYNIFISDNDVAPNGSTGIDDATDLAAITGALTSQYLLNSPSDITAGNRADYVITRKDQYGNLSTSGAETIYLYSNSTTGKFYDSAVGGGIITSIQIANGNSSANVWYQDTTAGSANITVSDSSSGPDGNSGINDASDTILISSAITGSYFLNDPGDFTAGTRIMYTATRKDQYGNLVTNGAETAYLYTSSATGKFYDSAVNGNIITSIQFNSGNSTADFWYYDETEGGYTITLSDNSNTPDWAAGIIDATDMVSVNVAPIVAMRFTILNPQDNVVGEMISITIRAEDNAGNVDTTYESDVTLTTSGSATLGGLVDIVAGIGTINITDTVAETVVLSLSDTQSTGLNYSSQQDVVFTAGPTGQFILNDPGDAVAGNRLAYTATRKDQYGNLVTNGAETIYLYSNSTTGKFYDSAIGGNLITSTSFSNGASDVSFWSEEQTIGSWFITASDNPLVADGDVGINDASEGFDVSSNITAQYLLNDPGDMTAGTRIMYTATRKDQYGNLVTNGTETAYLYTSSATGKFYDSAVGEDIITHLTIQNNHSTGNFWYSDETAGIANITISDNSSVADGDINIDDYSDGVLVSTAPIVATRFVILNPQDAQIGNSTTITIRAEDNAGNVDTTYQNDVTLVASGSATGDGLVNIINGIGTKNITDAVAETITLSLLDSEITGLDVSSNQNVVFSTEPVVPVAGSFGKFVAEEPVKPKLVFSGKAFPGARIVISSMDGEEIPLKESTIVSSSGTYNISFSDLIPGTKAFVLSIFDKDNHIAETKIYNLELSANITEKNIFTAPSVYLSRPTINKGGFLEISGFAIPGNQIKVFVDGKEIEINTTAKSSGAYSLLYNTESLELGRHSLSVIQVDYSGRKSDFSISKGFSVTNVFVPATDLNNDSRVDVLDWSIFLSKWVSKDINNKKVIDFNKDGKIDIQDLSIFARTLK